MSSSIMNALRLSNENLEYKLVISGRYLMFLKSPRLKQKFWSQELSFLLHSSRPYLSTGCVDTVVTTFRMRVGGDKKLLKSIFGSTAKAFKNQRGAISGKTGRGFKLSSARIPEG
ncbi:hypothetical protein CEXT_95981 [Caerostris extrusa]|uniref:Uncharacterized protein n=1 Tax=Caerostris extrusa TaxID=172846 RepID=A0AAV4W4K8_CAEEX|nr:hypothetical protein CEXT_95981 [Caerostris extrusa]